MRQAGGKETKGEEVEYDCEVKAQRNAMEGTGGIKKGTEAGVAGKGRNQEGMECISALPAER